MNDAVNENTVTTENEATQAKTKALSKSPKCKNMMYAQKLSHLPNGIKGRDDLEAVVEDKLKPQKYAIIVHDKETDKKNGQPKEPDIHIMLCFKNARYVDAVAKILGDKPQYIQAWNESANNGFSYLIHRTKKARSEGKHEYDPSEVTANFDFAALVKRLEAKTVQATTENGLTPKEMLNLLYVGTMSKDEVEKHLTGSQYGQYRRQIEDVWNRRLKMMAAEWLKEMKANGRSIQVIWIYGPAGTGKTSLAKGYAEKVGQPYFISGSSRDLFQSYAGEHTLILDELRPRAIPYQDLLRITDPYGEQVMAPSRYSDKALACDVIIITSPYDPLKFYWDALCIRKGCERTASQVDSIDQLVRRLALIIKIDHEYIEARKYDKAIGDYETENRITGKGEDTSETAFIAIPGTQVENPYAIKLAPKDNTEAMNLYRSMVAQQAPSENTPPQGRTAEKETSTEGTIPDESATQD